VSTAQPPFTTAEKDLVPEGLFDERQDALPGSMHLKKIIQIPMQGKITDFVPERSLQSASCAWHSHRRVRRLRWGECRMNNGKTELLHFDVRYASREISPRDGKHIE
jgi:hypothetical protein